MMLRNWLKVRTSTTLGNRFGWGRSRAAQRTGKLAPRSAGPLVWEAGPLERRTMLDAAAPAIAVAAVAATDAVAEPTVVAGPSADDVALESTQLAPTESVVVFLDDRVASLEQWAAEIPANAELVLIHGHEDGLQQMSRALSSRRHVKSVHVIGHGAAGQMLLGKTAIDSDGLAAKPDVWQAWRTALTADADVLVYGCEVGQGAVGANLVSALAAWTGADVAASTDRTGSERQGANWNLELQVGNIEAPLVVSAALQAEFRGVLPISVFAAGDTGQERLELQIDGVTVQAWDNVGGNAANRTFQEFVYAGGAGVTADRVRVAFTNDLYDPGVTDRNLIVDRIVVNGVTLETEDPRVFSTGTWLAADGVTPGFRQSETLHTNGYFEYYGTPATAGSVVINEIHYNPGPDGTISPDAEFLELYNPGTTAVDLSGMRFTGFELVFAAGTTLGAGQYAIVAPSTAIAQSQWAVTPIAQFTTGGLAGGGELIQLLAADGVTVVDEVNFDDVAPWPGAPDGNGPSLELVNPTLDNSLATNWAASTGNPTPGAQNSVYSTGTVNTITNITVTPGDVLPGQAFTISATIPNATVATLKYRIGFGDELQVAMTSVGGNRWEATLPGQQAGALVRYRIESDVAVAPFAGDTRNYLGFVVEPTDITGNSLPVFHWFVDPAQFENLVTNLYLTDEKIPAVIAFGDQVYDNATVRVRGSFSRTFPKKGFKFELPKGYTIDFGPFAQYPLDEFAIQADFADWTGTSAQIAWEVFNAETDSTTSTFFSRIEQNGEFYGLYRIQELYDGLWRTTNGYADGEFFDAETGWNDPLGFEKKEPDDGDFTSLRAIESVLNLPASDFKTQWLYDNVNVPSMINYMAISALMRHWDQVGHNFSLSLDEATSRWEQIEWDLDLTWRDAYGLTGAGTPFTTMEAVDNIFLNSIWEVPEFRDMYWRRMETLVDKYLGDNRLIDRRNQILAAIGTTNSALEFAKWGRSDLNGSDYFVQEWQQTIDARRTAYATDPRFRDTTGAPINVVINELHYGPASTDAEFLELYNAGSVAVDLSGWKIDAVGLTVENGTVILPGQYVVFTDNDAQFKVQSTANRVLVGGQYSGGLRAAGELVSLVDAAGTVRDSVNFTNVAPWPVGADGTGFTIALINPALDNSVASNWTLSRQVNGTPGQNNDTNVTVPNFPVDIYATGTTGQEVIALEVSGRQVAVFNLANYPVSAGDFNAGVYQKLSWLSDTPVTAANVRVVFLNDAFDAATNLDRNVRIDRIELNGAVFQTEAPNVFSTGTYANGGVTPGFKQSEVLHVNGYFEYGQQIIVNRPPVAVNDVATTAAATAVAGNVLTNDSDPDNNPLTVTGSTSPANGVVTVALNGAFTYTPNANFSGTDRFDYTISDGAGGTATASVNVTVTPPPVLANGATIQLLNLQDQGRLAADAGTDAVTSTVNNSRTYWDLVAVTGTNRYRLRNVSNGRYLDGDLLGIDTTSNVSDTGTVWEFRSVGTNQFQLYNVDYRQLLDSNGSNAAVTYDVGSPESDDTWVVSRVTRTLLADGSVVKLLNVNDNGYLGSDLLTTDARTTTSLTSRAQWQLIAAGAANQFRLRNVGNQRYLDGDLLDVDTTSLSSDSGTIWEFRAGTNGNYYLYNVTFGQFLDSNGANAALTYDVGSLENDDLWTVSFA